MMTKYQQVSTFILCDSLSHNNIALDQLIYEEIQPQKGHITKRHQFIHILCLTAALFLFVFGVTWST